MIKKIVCVILIISSFFAFSCGGTAKETVEFHRGKVENNIYENEMANIVFAPGPAWEFSSDADIMNINGIELEPDYDESELDEKLGKLSIVFDMTAQDTNTPSSIAITFQNMNSFIGGTDTTTDEYLDKLKEEIEEKFSGYGASASKGDLYEIAGESYYSLEVEMTIGERNIKQYYFIRRIGVYFLSVDITCSVDTDVKRDILTLFDKYR